ncbi:serine-rich coiled-coil domain-containing protein 2 isoform X3 [Clupea harengus]|uniref:Serine-rich coiled-coil domain-containing protein 2 isoform X3 n=1 Tax=Clupea harengus TaxID=7950 RepID=A0A6P8F4V8_CLUHA|nr:serine-rich coiled-coil domain-containing protein 2 isoform X3 [Clupea harengus]
MQLMEEQALRQPGMVSRLPKFGSRPTGSVTLPGPNGCAAPSAPPVGKVLATVRQNGIVRPSPAMSFKWKGEKAEPDPKVEEGRGGAYRAQQQQQQQQQRALVREIKRPSAPIATVRRPAPSVSTSSYRTGHQPPASMRFVPNHSLSNDLTPGPTHGGLSQSSDSLRLLPLDNMVRSQSFSHMTHVAGSGENPIARSFSFNQELPRPASRHPPSARCTLPLPTPILNGARGVKTGIARGLPAGPSLLPPTNLKKPLLPGPAPSKPSALSYRLMRPSLIRQPRPTPVGKAQEEPAKEQKEGSRGDAPVAPRPTKTSGNPVTTARELSGLPDEASENKARPHELRSEHQARIEDPRVWEQKEHESLGTESRLDGLRTIGTREEESWPDNPIVEDPDKAEADEPRAVHLSAIKTRAINTRADEPSLEDEITTDREDPLESSPDESCDPRAEAMEELPTLRVTSVTGEPMEEMSLSSTSSLERNDTSEEYMDDFDNLGNGGGILLLPTHDGGLVQPEPLSEDSAPAGRQLDVCSVTSIHSFLSESVDWGEMGLTGGKEAFSVPGRGVLSDGVFRDGSSLDLSPSDSSGATYMWDDEDGLEPLGGPLIPCRSYDSDLNSMDILNNLDNLESCDLDEDDLMLDVDLPEESSLHSDADGRWRRRQQQLWGTQEHLHNNNNSDGLLQALDGLDVDLVDHVDHVSLDELTLQHMAQDCSSVKNQLLQLRQLLEVEEADCIDEGVSSSGAFTPDSSEDVSCDQQVQELLMEVQKLREELRSKDKMIAQLTQQMCVPEEASRCSCDLKRTEVQRGTRPLHQDCTTQTPWRGHAGLLPPSLLPPWLCPKQTHPRARLPLLHRKTSNSTAFQSRTQSPLTSGCTSRPQRPPGKVQWGGRRCRPSTEAPVLPSILPRPPLAGPRRTPAPPPPPARLSHGTPAPRKEGPPGRPPENGARSKETGSGPHRERLACGLPPPPERPSPQRTGRISATPAHGEGGSEAQTAAPSIPRPPLLQHGPRGLSARPGPHPRPHPRPRHGALLSGAPPRLQAEPPQLSPRRLPPR